MKNALKITFKDLTQQLKRFGLSARLQAIADEIKDRKSFEQEFALDEMEQQADFAELNEVAQ